MRWRAVAAAVAVGAVLAPAVPARARAVGCARAPAAGVVRAGLPFETRWYGVPALASVATGTGVRVAVLDSGVDASHPQLRGRVAAGRDFLRGGVDGRQDCVGHGTAVAGIIAAGRVDGVGFAGVAPGVTVVPVRVSEQERIGGAVAGARGSPRELARAIRWAADPAGGGAQVINLSVVTARDHPGVRRAVAAAIGSGVVVVAAAGNDGGAVPVSYPAGYPGVIGVGAVTAEGARAAFSPRGGHVDLVAAGVGVTAPAVGSGHVSVQGTSFAAPFVAATAALVRQRFPGSTPEQVARRLCATADPAPGGAGYGCGLLNPYRAVAESLDPGGVRAAAPVLRGAGDPVGAAARVRRDVAQRRALLVAAGGLGLVLLVAVSAAVLRGGRRRGWRRP